MMKHNAYPKILLTRLLARDNRLIEAPYLFATLNGGQMMNPSRVVDDLRKAGWYIVNKRDVVDGDTQSKYMLIGKVIQGSRIYGMVDVALPNGKGFVTVPERHQDYWKYQEVAA